MEVLVISVMITAVGLAVRTAEGSDEGLGEDDGAGVAVGIAVLVGDGDGGHSRSVQETHDSVLPCEVVPDSHATHAAPS